MNMKSLFPALIIFLALPCAALDFTEREISVITDDGLKLGATLTVPSDRTPDVVAVFATGSGTQNRDEEVFGKKPFRTLAHYLAERGVASLRVDDRGFDNPSDAVRADMWRCCKDVREAFELADSLFPYAKVGIIGHSAGGSYAIINASRNKDVDFIVTLAAPAWRGDSLSMAQSRALAVATKGRWDEEALQRTFLDIAMSDTPELYARSQITQLFESAYGETARLPEMQSYIQAQITALLSPYFRSMMRYEPDKDISSVTVPFLALNGSLDMQVPPGNLATISSLNPGARTVLLDEHNHLFQHCRSGLPQEYPTIPGDFSEECLEVIAGFLASLSGK